MSDKKIEKLEGPRAFARFIENVGYGQAHTDLSVEMQELGRELYAMAMHMHSPQKGKLTLELAFTVDPDCGVAVRYQIKTKRPDRQRPGSVFWVTKHGNLTVEDPRQQKLPLREVSAPPADVREAIFEDSLPARGV